SRNAHDFDVLAGRLGNEYRVISVDMVGRGRSSWLEDKSRHAVPVYTEHMRRFLNGLGLNRVTWIGTSMGGIIGMALSAAQDSPIHRLVLNDIGAFVGHEAMAEISGYLKTDPTFSDLDEAERYLRHVHSGFGQLDDARWREIARYSTRSVEHGLKLHFDPALIVPFNASAADDIDLWEIYEAIRCPVLLLHGEESRILTAQTARAMTERGPKATLIDYPAVGHAPSLMVEEQIRDIETWLERTPIIAR
ncbi:MAG: alpha/beta hydrolase, partial [Pseudomonadota bacterium]